MPVDVNEGQVGDHQHHKGKGTRYLVCPAVRAGLCVGQHHHQQQPHALGQAPAQHVAVKQAGMG